MSRIALVAYLVALACLAGAVVAAVAQPEHWKRTLVVALVVGAAAAGVGVTRPRSTAQTKRG